MTSPTEAMVSSPLDAAVASDPLPPGAVTTENVGATPGDTCACGRPARPRDCPCGRVKDVK